MSKRSREKTRRKGMVYHRTVRDDPVSITELAAVIGVSPSVMSRIERGDIGLDVADAFDIAKRLGCRMEDLL